MSERMNLSLHKYINENIRKKQVKGFKKECVKKKHHPALKH